MRGAIFFGSLCLAVPAHAVELDCVNFGYPTDAAWCRHWLGSLPGYDQTLIDDPGLFAATLTFESPLENQATLSGHRMYHSNVYDSDGKLILGRDRPGGIFLGTVFIPAGTTEYAFKYVIPNYRWGSENGQKTVYGTNNDFHIDGPLPGFRIDVTRVNAVPEPANWAMMIAGFGAIGAAFRSKAALARHSRL